VTVTFVGVEKVVLGTGRHTKQYPVLGVGYSGGLDPTAAQNLAAYTVISGKVENVHKVSEVVYNKPVPLTQAIYYPSMNFVALVPNGQRKLPKFEQLHVNVSLVTDPQGRPINDGQNLTATATPTGLALFTQVKAAAIERPAPGSVDALFEQGLLAAVDESSDGQ
jgi:hypothetical protein